MVLEAKTVSIWKNKDSTFDTDIMELRYLLNTFDTADYC